jgi:hypothetical protein
VGTRTNDRRRRDAAPPLPLAHQALRFALILAVALGALGLTFGAALVVVDVSVETPTANGNLGALGALLAGVFLVVVAVDAALLVLCIRSPHRGAATTAVVSVLAAAGWVLTAALSGTWDSISLAVLSLGFLGLALLAMRTPVPSVPQA